MKLNYTTGCICDNLSVDDKQFNSLSIKERKNILCKIINDCSNTRCNEEYFLQQMLIAALQNAGEFEYSDEPCECCGDNIETFDLEIEE